MSVKSELYGVNIRELAARICALSPTDLGHAIETQLPSTVRRHFSPKLAGVGLHQHVILSLADLVSDLGTVRLTPTNLAHVMPFDVNAVMSFFAGIPETLPNDTVRASLDDYVLRILEDASHEALDRFVDDSGIPTYLPLLDQVGREADRSPDIDLSHDTLIAVQHILGSSVPLFKWINQLGIPYDRMFLLGKAYSSNRAAFLRLKRLGVNVHEQSVSLTQEMLDDDRKDYQGHLGHRAARPMVDRALSDWYSRGADGRLLVLDEGGVLAAAFRMYNLLDRVGRQHPLVAVVEQTRRGIGRLEDATPKDTTVSEYVNFPVVDVAQSHAKLTWEAPIVARSICRELQSRLKTIFDGRGLSSRKVLVIGFGALGSQVCAELKTWGAEVWVYDNDSVAATRAQALGFHVSDLEEAGRECDVILGCSGSREGPSIEAWADKRGIAAFASASSSDVEMGVYSLRASASMRLPWPYLDEVEADSDFQRIHGNYVVDRPGRELVILNGGFPVNFTGSIDPIPPDVIQLTRALMLAGLCEASISTGRRGLVPLGDGFRLADEDAHSFVLNRFRELDLDSDWRHSLLRAGRQV